MIWLEIAKSLSEAGATIVFYKLSPESDLNKAWKSIVPRRGLKHDVMCVMSLDEEQVQSDGRSIKEEVGSS